MTAPIQLMYRAFLSYAHADASWGRWLHRQLEGFRIDTDLAGRATALGPVPKTLRPIFRDREDFSGGHSLTEATIAALDQSAALIVLCSPVAATRPAVHEEVRLFRSRHPGRPVIPVILDGTYPDNFPPALRFEVTPEGEVTDRQLTVLAPDLRDSGDGKSLGVAKIVAGLTGLAPDDIWRRAERARRRSVRLRNGVIGVLALLVVAAGFSAYLFREELRRNEALLDRTLERATTLINKTVLASDQFGVPRMLSLVLLAEAEHMFTDISELGSDSPKLSMRKAQMLIEFARTYSVLGQSEKQRERASEAEQLMARLLERDADNDGEARWRRALALTELGDALEAQGRTEQAREMHLSAARIMDALSKSHPTRRTMFALRVSFERLSRIDVVTGNLPRGIEAARLSLMVSESLAAEEPDNIEFKRSLSNAHTNLGDIFLATGNLSMAQEHQRKALTIDLALAAAEPRSTAVQAALAVSYERNASLHGAVGDFAGALENYGAARVILDRLVSADPTNATWQNNICTIVGRIGDTYLALGQFLDARTAYGHALTKRYALTKLDPANASWRFATAIDHFRLALSEALSSAGDPGRAVEAAKALYALKESVSETELDRFAQITVAVFSQAKTNSEAREQLGKAVEIVRQMGQAGRLSGYSQRWGRILEAAYRAIADVRQ